MPSAVGASLLSNKIDLRKLPPLNALKGFEATVRRQSVREAAEELCLTHPAVSHQIQQLEADLGVALFAREGRHIHPTAEGLALYTHVRQALSGLIAGAESIRGLQTSRPIRIQTYVTASLRWLAPRIPALCHDLRDTHLWLSTCAPEWEFDESVGDIGLVYCDHPPQAPFVWEPLFDYVLQPVCTAQLAQTLGPTPTPEDIGRLPLIVTYSERHAWNLWFESVGAGNDHVKAPVVVDTLALALEMALKGHGVALLNGPFADEELAAGTLIKPIDRAVKAPGSWGLIARPEVMQNPRVAAVVAWLKKSVT
jgi:LysR family transcriptional regulator, glycine cleavage system transcriptional activator